MLPLSYPPLTDFRQFVAKLARMQCRSAFERLDKNRETGFLAESDFEKIYAKAFKEERNALLFSFSSTNENL